MWARRTMCAGVLAATAQTAAAEDCDAERAFLFDALGRNGWAVEDEGDSSEVFGACRTRDLVLLAEALRIEAALVEWRLSGLSALEDQSGLVTLEANLDNLRMVPTVDDPWVSYMLSEQNRRNLIDGTLTASWNLDDGAVELEEFTLDLPGENAVSVAFQTSGMTPALLAGRVTDFAALSVSRMEIVIDNNGFADGLILGYLVGAMSGLPGAPESQMNATRDDAMALVGGLPDGIFTAGSKDALTRLIADAPVPWGTLGLTLVADPALPLARLVPLALQPDPLSPDALTAAFDGAMLEVTYVPSPDPE